MAKARRGSLSDAMDKMSEIRAKEAAVAAASEDPAPPESLPVAAPKVPAQAEQEPEAKPLAKDLKTKISLYLDRDLVERARGAVAWAQMRGADPDSISTLMNGALEGELARLLDVLKPDTGDFPNLSRGRKGRPPGS